MNPLSSPLLTDLYQLTMLQGYLEQGMDQPAAFEFFVRKLPESRNFLVAAGLEQALDFLENLPSAPRLEWIAASGLFKDLVDYLEKLRFTGDVHGIPEGTVVFANEPLLRVTAALPQAQLVETRLINLLHFSTMIASKAARSVLAAPGKLLVDFGLRRAHGAEAGLLAARAAYAAGFSGSATVLAAPCFGVPVYGTMAHSFVQAHDDEAAAFEHFARSFPGNAVLLIDTYDTEAAARKAVALAPRLAADGIAIKGVRLDSGDLASHARKVRQILDQGGLEKTVIFASGNLDEYRLKALLDSGAPIDGFGVGTSLVTSGDAPSLDSVYKLMEYAGRPRRKRSEGKATWPGRKQVYRRYGPDGRMREDLMTIEADAQEGDALIQPLMTAGRRLVPPPGLAEIRARALRQYALLPEPLKSLDTAAAYSVVVSDALRRLAAEVDRLQA